MKLFIAVVIAVAVSAAYVLSSAQAADQPRSNAEGSIMLQGQTAAAPKVAAKAEAAIPQTGTTDAATADATDPSGDSNSDTLSQPQPAPAPVHQQIVSSDYGGCWAFDPVFVQFDGRQLAALKAARARLAEQKEAASAKAVETKDKGIPALVVLLKSILEK